MVPDTPDSDSPPNEPVPDLTRYVRVRRVVDDKFIEFDFAIGDPSLYVELVLPRAAFDEFCSHNKVRMMTEEEAAAVDADMAKWRYGEEAVSPDINPTPEQVKQ